MMKITAVVLTKNEDKNIERCLRSLSFCDEIVIVDDFSDDKTLEKIKNRKFKFQIQSKINIFQRKLNGDFAAQRNYGMEKAGNDWVLHVDADEEVSLVLREDIHVNYQKGFSGYQAYLIRRRDYFWNRELKHGEVSKMRQVGLIRLIRKDSGKWMGDVHEVFYTANRIGKLKGFLNHLPHPTLKEFINDINYYSTIRAEELFSHGTEVNVFEIMFVPPFKFIYTFFILLGFLDGSAGFTYAFMMSFHSFLVRAKLYQMSYKK